MVLMACVGAMWVLILDEERPPDAEPPAVMTASPQAALVAEEPPVADAAPARDVPVRTAVQYAASFDRDANVPPGTIVVRVHASDGKPFEGTWKLEIEDLELSREGKPSARRSTVQSSHTVSVSVRGGVLHAVCARSRGLVTPTVRCKLDRASPTATIDLSFETAAEVTGRIVDPKGEGVHAMPVWLVPRFHVGRANSAAAPGSSTSPLMVGGMTDENGVFTLSAFQPGRWHVFAGDRQNPITRIRDVEIEAGTRALDTLKLPRLHSVVVRVVDEEGAPLPDLRVEGNGIAGGGFEGVTNASGELACENMPDGEWRLQVVRPDGTRAHFPVRIPVERAEQVVELRVRSDAATRQAR
jgi:hypothetical protein